MPSGNCGRRSPHRSCWPSFGVPQSDDLTNHQAYVADWLKALQDDARYISTASTAAGRAADFILSRSRPTEIESEPESEAVLVG